MDNGWISVKDRLPDYADKSYHPISHACLCRDMHNQYGTAIYYTPTTDICNPWITSDEDLDTDLITHWMPLPEPPKEEQHG